MFCPYCGKQLPDETKFCGGCGAKLMPQAPVKKSGKATKIIAVLAVVILLLAAGSAALLLLGGNSDPWQKQYDRGMDYLSDGEYEEAAEAFLKAIKIDDDRPEAYKRAAKAYVKMEDYEAAIEILEEGIEETDDEDLVEELEDLMEKMAGESGDFTGDHSWVETTAPEVMVTVYLPTRMEKTIYDETTSVWVETYTYDQQGNMVEIVQENPKGTITTTRMMYDDAGRMIRSSYTGSTAQYIHTYVYDSLNRQIETSYNDKVYTYELDDQGRLSRYQKDESEYRVYVYGDDGCSHVLYVYNSENKLTEYTEVYCDERGNIVSTWRYHYDYSLLYRTDFIFDENNNMIKKLCYAFCSADHVGTTYTYYYDEYNNLIRVVYEGDYYSSDSDTVYTIGPVEVTESAAARLGQ